MKSAICICSMITALLVVFGCFMGVDYLGLRVNESLPVLAPVETITDVTTIIEVSSVPEESPTDTVSSMPSSVDNKKPATSKTTSSHVATSKVSSKTSSVSSAVKKPTVTLKKDTNTTKIVTYIKRPTYSSVQKEIKALAKKYPKLIQVASIGKSVQGRDLTLMKVGKGKQKACIIAGIHARESMTVSYLMRCVEEFCAAYGSKSGKYSGFDMKNLLDNYTLYIVPLSNPDGLEIISGRDKPEVKITYREEMTMEDYKANANGVNLNKNFPLLWNQIDNKVVLPDPEGYKGPSAGSEPETKALMKLCKNNDFSWMTSVHVRGDCLYWSDTLNPSVGASETIADVLKDRCDFYKCNTSEDVNGFGGGFENWFRNEFKRPGFCLELMPLDVKVTPTTNGNHQYFSSTVRWNVTKTVLPYMMVYGFIG
ncbi:MAG: hypothetical protein IKM39_00130 [Clostridia bacterium]|nr:hypothetical protein [Clostridia bacterium]